MDQYQFSLYDSDISVIQDISPNDEMFQGNKNHYFNVGKSALRNIECALLSTQKPASSISCILDLPCGHGRVLRYLRAAFPLAEITACDLLRDGVDFCASTFDAVPVYSIEDPLSIPLKHDSFDLIWVGSLFTHLDSKRWSEFLKTFRSCLKPGGVVVFSTHGRQACHLLSSGTTNYGLTPDQLKTVLTDFINNGFGYSDYTGFVNYGISLTELAWVCVKCTRISGLRIVYVHEKAWDNHHDVLACVHDPDWIADEQWS